LIKLDWRQRRITSVVVPLTVLSLLAATQLSVNAFAQGGTAKPPQGAVAPFITATLPDPVTSVDPALIHGFDDTGFIQAATVDATNVNCPNTTDPHRFGGTLTLNHGPIVIPCNLVIQAPANTFTWADFINGGPSLVVGAGYPSFEMRAVGNVVGPRRIAGLLYASQQSFNTSTGVITGIDYATGNLLVDTGSSAVPAIVQINDPNGRFGRAQSPDSRFSVDDANPTIHGGTGYPMCVPRTNPAVADDPLCPQANRPNLVAETVNGVVMPPVAGGCRNFSVSAIAPPVSGELNAPAAGQAYCSQFVMKSVAARTATDPDPRQQAPFEVGDSITVSGTLIAATATAPTYTSAHTIEANVGIYTFPGTQPSYLAIGDFGVGTADPNAVSINGLAVETQDRIFLEAETTDVKTPVDIYMMDVNPVTGAVRNRWATPFEMTGEQNGPVQADGVTPIGGGITTQQSGPQPQRARLRATKAPVGLLSQPTRDVRVAVRSLCTPQAPVNDAAGNPVLTALDTCLNNTANNVANGLEAGQYFAPTFEYIFPENVKPGDLLVPFDFWHLPFLVFGEGATTQSPIGPGVGPLEPNPWSGAPASVPGAPVIGAATAGNAAASVSWTPPVSDGGSPITGFTVTALDGAGNVAGTVTVAGNVTTATVTGLTNGTAVTLQVAASNPLGTGPASGTSNAVTPAGAAPGAPTIGSATAGSNTASVGWTPPVFDGGSPITGYTIIALDAAGATAATVFATAPAATATVTGLTNGQSYRLQVSASNAAGSGPFSAPSATVTPATVPGAPVIGTPIAGNASALVSWARPTSDGGSAITGYSVRVFDAANVQVGGFWPAAAGATSLTVTGLANGSAVTFQVQASNAMGTGAFSASSAAVTPAPTVPGAPIVGAATIGNGSALVSFAAPSNGGAAITGFLVRVVNAATNVQVGALRPAAAAATSLTVTGLANGTAVAFQVQASNAVGAGAFSALSAAVTPAPTVPGAPRIGVATRGNASALVRWTAPANGGSPITGFLVRVFNAANVQVGALRPAPAGTTSLTVTGLVNGTAVRFQVRARNAVGIGAPSALSAAVTPAKAPGAPVIRTASSGVARGVINAVARWTPPASNGGAAINGYVVTALRLNAAGRVLGQTTSAVQPATLRALTMRLAAGNYRFVVRARNPVGLGANSARSNLVTAR
jgi:hypothetical protein